MNTRSEFGGAVGCVSCGATEWHRRDPALCAVANGWCCTGTSWICPVCLARDVRPKRITGNVTRRAALAWLRSFLSLDHSFRTSCLAREVLRSVEIGLPCGKDARLWLEAHAAAVRDTPQRRWARDLLGEVDSNERRSS